MENKDIIRALRETASSMEILGENPFKVRAVTSAIFNLERLENRIADLSQEEIHKIDGIGKSIAQQIAQLLDQGTSEELQRLTESIPEGVRDMQRIGGLGAKKIRQLWQEFGIDSIRSLSQFIAAGELAKVKGFGEKTIQQISGAIAFMEENSRRLLLPEALEISRKLVALLSEKGIRIEETGQLRRRDPVIDELSYLADANSNVADVLGNSGLFALDETQSSPFTIRGRFNNEEIPVRLRLGGTANWGTIQLKQTGPPAYLHTSGLIDVLSEKSFADEEEAFRLKDLAYRPADLRGAPESAQPPIENSDIRGILHAHSTYSDGQNSLSEMIEACIARGYAYFGITDHSRSSYFYANGLFENRVIDQLDEIALLRDKYPDFTIFSGIECDILSDGGLDYAEDILKRFDFIVASVHSVLQMDRETATRRLVKAIENPYTTILGHLTGRLLLRRQGYPLNMAMILDACAANDVAIELNANPRRLDIDYTYLQEVRKRNILISINPDAHSISGIDDVSYGVQMARKGGLSATDNLTSFTAGDLAAYFSQRKKKRTAGS